MSDLDELEFDGRVRVDSKRAAASHRNGLKGISKMQVLAGAGHARREFYATGNKPSLPRLKCLEKDQ